MFSKWIYDFLTRGIEYFQLKPPYEESKILVFNMKIHFPHKKYREKSNFSNSKILMKKLEISTIIFIYNINLNKS